VYSALESFNLIHLNQSSQKVFLYKTAEPPIIFAENRDFCSGTPQFI
jgi:hypothetical protein